MLAWAVAFACTLALETPVYVLGLRRTVGARRAALWSVALNLSTHPSAWALTRAWSWPRFGAVETGVWLLESAGLLALLRLGAPRTIPAARALALTLTANALSAGFGLLI
ncbi:MAG TPA: hypothetical protein VMT03_00570 [Polyangia bacterium]|nr:hypothetical protein [Polyangia bacterium]